MTTNILSWATENFQTVAQMDTEFFIILYAVSGWAPKIFVKIVILGIAARNCSKNAKKYGST